MNREELIALALTDEQVNGVMKLHGKAIVELQNGLSAAQADSETAKAELKKYQKGGELYIDGEEHTRLKNFETETLSKETNAKKTAALTKLFKGANASDSATKLLISGSKLDELELDDKGEIKGATDILKKAQAEYADLFSTNGNAGVPHANEGDGTSANNPHRRKVF
jgi:hypothetical protein